MKDSRLCIYEPQTPQARGFVLLVPGLNLKANKLEELALFFTELGYRSAILSLSGSQEGDEIKGISERRWIAEIHEHYLDLQSRTPEGEKILLGYSMGALLITRALDEDSKIQPDKLIFFAPALGLPFFSQAARPLTWMRHLGLGLPAFTPGSYKARSVTPLASYRVLYDAYDRTRTLQHPERLQIPIRVVMSAKDGLVSYSRVRKWFRDNALQHTSYLKLKPHPDGVDGVLNHLIIDRKSLGQKSWGAMEKNVRRFLEKDKARGVPLMKSF